MKRFHVAYPTTADEAAGLLQTDAVIVGGGTLTVPALTRGELNTAHVVDLGRLGLDEIVPDGTVIRLGAMVSYQQLITSALVAERLPMPHRMASGITGGIQIRHQGTVGGSACAARPNSDVPAVLVAMRAEMLLRSPAGTRRVPVDEFFLGAERADLRRGEFLTEIAVPSTPPGWTTGYYKLKFAESSWPVVTAACVLPPAGSAEVTIGGVADVPLRITLPETNRTEHTVAERISAIPTERRWSDLRADARYRARVAGEIACRAVRQALAARGDQP
ncbi:xanthine dehydrogenase family protein subunit M [Amycolatopsis sp. GM8]|uniref:FAD binding domain-containing protein n=1 Tax=Amycolatopsis sp. GM8 TaxID=2896530 RepID=UPI001F3463AC|nr:FAD binding domain-containing protein [Amycolatopsis sp. GM8]